MQLIPSATVIQRLPLSLVSSRELNPSAQKAEMALSFLALLAFSKDLGNWAKALAIDAKFIGL